jgi:hypothetical protein
VANLFSSIQGLVMRATRLDVQGKWVTSATGAACSKGFISVQMNANIEEGEEFKVKNAAGVLCISEKGCPSLNFLELTIEFCNVDPELFELITGTRLLVDYAGAGVGFTQGKTIRCEGGFALEVWTRVAGGSVAGSGYVYFLLPQVVNAIIAPGNIENGPMTFTLTGNSKANPNWGLGPWNVVAQTGSTPPTYTAGKLLTPGVLADEHMYMRLTEIAPPACDVGGYQTVSTAWVTPPVVPSKGAAAPTNVFPAEPTVTASDSTNAAKLAALGYVANPTTAWTTGQKITIGTFDFNWSGTAWAAGAHA